MKMAAVSPDGKPIDIIENRRRMQAGELYYAFTPDLMAARKRAQVACEALNSASRDISRRNLVELVRNVLEDERPLPPGAATEEEDEALFEEEPWIERPLTMDYGFNVKLGAGVFVNFSSVWLDTCPITVGARTLIGPNCSFCCSKGTAYSFILCCFR